MDNFIFSVNATMPIFLTMMLGLLFRRTGLMDADFARKMNKFVFKAALPAMVFRELSQVDIKASWNGGYVLFCFLATSFSILIITLWSYLLKDRSLQGEFVQASYRSSAAILGLAFINNIYGEAHIASLMIIGTVPLYNIMAVIVLSLLKPGENTLNRKVLKKTAVDILKNPIILGIAAGFAWSMIGIPQGVIFQKTLNNLAALATPLGLMSMGASIEFRQMTGRIGTVLTASATKLLLLPAICIPAAVFFGYRQEELVAILVMAGSATTVSSYIMAKNMGHEGGLTSGVVMITTLCSSFTLAGWLFLLRSFALI